MLIISGLIYAGVFSGASVIAGIFNSEGNEVLRNIAVRGLKIYFTACPFAGFNIIISVYFTSMEYALPAHVISLMRGFVLIIPMAFILSAFADMTGVWCAFPATEAAVAALGAVFYIRRGRRLLRL